MTKTAFNAEIQQHIGALNGIAETMPPCDKPCNVHEAHQVKQAHETAVVCLLAEFIGNGMADEIADKVTAKLATEPQKKTAFTFTLPGTDKMVSVAKSAISTWTFRLVILPLIVYWMANGKIDRDTVREVVADAVRAQRELTQPLSHNDTTLENTVGLEK